MDAERGQGPDLGAKSSRPMADLVLDGDRAVGVDAQDGAFALRERGDQDAVRVRGAAGEAPDRELGAGRVADHEHKLVLVRRRPGLHDPERLEDAPLGALDEVGVRRLDVREGVVVGRAVRDPLLHRGAEEVERRGTLGERAVARTLEEGHGGLRGAHHGGHVHPQDDAPAQRLLADETGVFVALVGEDVAEGALALAGVAEEDDLTQFWLRGECPVFLSGT